MRFGGSGHLGVVSGYRLGETEKEGHKQLEMRRIYITMM
jgi:hypothetical protein